MNTQKEILRLIERHAKRYLQDMLGVTFASSIDMVYKIILQKNSSQILIGDPLNLSMYASLNASILERLSDKNKEQVKESIEEEALKIESSHELLNLVIGYALKDMPAAGEGVKISPPEGLDAVSIECSYESPCYRLELKSAEYGSVTFFAMHSDAGIEEEIKKEVSGAKKSKTSVKVMVVDDANISVQKTSLLLEEIGHKVVGSCDSGLCAVKKYGIFNPDIVTMDVSMPDMDGIEATRKILEDFPDALIVMLTTHGQEKLVMEAIKAGAKGYILKPVAKDKLGETIDKVIEKFKD